MSRAGRWMTGLLLLEAVLCLSSSLSVAGQVKAEAAAVGAQEVPALPVAGQAPAETVHPGPQSLKETWAIGIFLVWMWLSIIILIYFLRLGIREADRITELSFDSPVRIQRDKRTS